MSVIKTDRWKDSNGNVYNNVLQVQHTLYAQTFMSMNGGTREVIPGFFCDITPRSRDSMIWVIGSLAVSWETTPEWSWYIDRTIGGADGHTFNSTALNVQQQYASNRMWGYHGGPRDGNSNNFTRELESYYHTVFDYPNTIEPVRYHVVLSDRWSTRDKYINRSAEDTNNGYITRGTSSLTLLEIAQ